MEEILAFINLEICERREYSATKAFEIVRDKIIFEMTNASYEIDRINLVSMTIRKDQLEEWLTEYRDQLKKENVYHKNQGIINAINEILDETSTDI